MSILNCLVIEDLSLYISGLYYNLEAFLICCGIAILVANVAASFGRSGINRMSIFRLSY